jgi:hypothetical protein
MAGAVRLLAAILALIAGALSAIAFWQELRVKSIRDNVATIDREFSVFWQINDEVVADTRTLAQLLTEIALHTGEAAEASFVKMHRFLQTLPGRYDGFAYDRTINAFALSEKDKIALLTDAEALGGIIEAKQKSNSAMRAEKEKRRSEGRTAIQAVDFLNTRLIASAQFIGMASLTLALL